MTIRSLSIMLGLLIAAGWPAASAHGQQSADKASAKKPAPDPNERICEDIVQTGTRMGPKRFCGTRAEWEERKREDREAIERAQQPMQCSVMGTRRC